MSQTLQDRQTQNTRTEPGERTEHRVDGFGWRRLLGRAALGAASALAFVSVVVFKTVVPPLAVMMLLLTAGGALALRSGKKGVAGVVLASAGALMLAGLGTGFVMGVIGAPEEPRSSFRWLPPTAFRLWSWCRRLCWPLGDGAGGSNVRMRHVLPEGLPWRPSSPSLCGAR